MATITSPSTTEVYFLTKYAYLRKPDSNHLPQVSRTLFSTILHSHL